MHFYVHCPELRKLTVKEIELKKCPQCDFISQNAVFFNEHITTAHAGQPNCPFSFLGFKDYLSLRKHCENSHTEKKDSV